MKYSIEKVKQIIGNKIDIKSVEFLGAGNHSEAFCINENIHKGLGSKMILEYIEQVVKKDKYDIAMISPDPENKAQQCLMKKCGFQYIKTVNVPYANSKSKESVYIKKLEKE